MEHFETWLLKKKSGLEADNDEAGKLDDEIESIDNAIHWFTIFNLLQAK